MKKNQSSLSENTISTCYFAVLPLHLVFKKNYDNKFTLYFQKSLQIISKFEATPTKDSQTLLFPIPTNIQHFRIQSQKSLDYQWSLYMHHQSESEENEEFLQGQKVSLKSAWANFNSKRQNFCQLDIEFNTIKCKFTFLVLIAKKSSDLPQIASRYSQSLQANIPNPIQEARVSEQIKQIRGKERKQQVIQSKQTIISSSEKMLQEVSVVRQNQDRGEKAVKDGKERQSGLMSTPQRENDSLQHKITPSQVKIGEDIEQFVNKYEAAIKQQVVNIKPFQEEPKRQITMTQSQLLNQQKQPITPIYKSKKFIIALILIILLSGVLFVSFGGKKAKGLRGKESKQKLKGNGKGKGKR